MNQTMRIPTTSFKIANMNEVVKKLPTPSRCGCPYCNFGEMRMDIIHYKLLDEKSGKEYFMTIDEKEKRAVISEKL